MDILFSCPECQQHVVIDATGAGLLVDCPTAAGKFASPVPSTRNRIPRQATNAPGQTRKRPSPQVDPPSANNYQKPKN